MGRFLAIDYGRKRVGLAVTDPLKIIATALTTVHAKDVLQFLDDYTKKEAVELFVIGLPKNLNNSDSESMKDVKPFAKKLAEKFPDIPIEWVDERFTSKLAQRALIDSGVKKMDRRIKENVDKVSAVIILQSYMEAKSYLN